MRRALLLCLPLALLTACGGDDDDPVDPPVEGCSPSGEAWNDDVQARVERYCGTCHGDEPNFGAPQTLTDLEALMDEDSDHLAQLISRIQDGTMPPTNMPRPPQADLNAIIDWASCGEETAPELPGLSSTAPVFVASDEGPAELEELELLAGNGDGFEVGEDLRDLYQCFTFTYDGDEDAFIRRFEMVIDQSEVLHHLVLLRDREFNAPDGDHVCFGMADGSEYLYAWAPGQGAVEFPEGGLRLRPGDKFVMQIHYNNGQMLEDVVDKSGVKLFLDEPGGTEYGMLVVGPNNFNVPARGSSSPKSQCTFDERVEVLTGMPHMHEVGDAFLQEVVRADGSREDFIELENWQFESQLFYSTPVVFEEGDKLETQCTFVNNTDTMVRQGARTEDEMCFNFMYVTPPPAFPYCDEDPSGVEVPTDVAHSPGECAPAGTEPSEVLVQGGVQGGGPAPLTGGELVDGVYEMSGFSFRVTDLNTPIGAVDTEESILFGRGYVWVEGDTITVDASTAFYLKLTSGAQFADEQNLSLSADVEADGGTLSWSRTCPGPQDPIDITFQVDGDQLDLQFEINQGIFIYPHYTFTRLADL